ncbi:AAEL008311-PA [Aedes aegypti]|uniref:AAEL008311-PA n=1 Tax=Aedes aegypti TaxID=7159 RepID=Q16Z55_AEDAE|nr:AAEL008311-PA [Aedes aegypti]
MSSPKNASITVNQIITINNDRARMDIACIIDTNHDERKLALEELILACTQEGANLRVLEFEKLDFDELETLDNFYNADVAVVDLSVQSHQSSLSYHLGVRESFKMKENIVMFNDVAGEEATQRIRNSCVNYVFMPYRVLEETTCVITAAKYVENLDKKYSDTRLLSSLRIVFQNVKVPSKAHKQEKFLADLRALRDQYAENIENLQHNLKLMRDHLNDPQLLSREIVHTFMLSLRDAQYYDLMIDLVDDFKNVADKQDYVTTNNMIYMYAFALNRRNNEGDREKALNSCMKALEKKENHFPDMLCLCGRIYKDIFVESDRTDMESLTKSIEWYKKSFTILPNLYAGVNLATLLIIQGKDILDPTLQQIQIVLSNQIGKEGALSSVEDYWNVATYFEISVLTGSYAKAIQAAERMFRLKPPQWYLKSTIRNITLIKCSQRKKIQKPITIERQIFHFWMTFFVDIINVQPSCSFRFPILIQESPEILLPSFVSINMDEEQKSIAIDSICLQHEKNKCQKIHKFKFLANRIKAVSLYTRDPRCASLYVQQNSDDFQMLFPTVQCRQRFYELILLVTADQNSGFVDLSRNIINNDVMYEYEFDDDGNRIILGQGSHGKVFSAWNLKTRMKIAVKEVPENFGQQILEGLNYLHKQQVVHRDIKGSNVLVNTYSGVVKITDFGTSKRLAVINPVADTFVGTIRYMAPEVIKGDMGKNRGYGSAADIWSFGCTVIEMATAEPPFIQIDKSEVIIYQVGSGKIHPEIPTELSPTATSFIMRCFQVDDAERATAEELLKDPFLSQYVQ